MVIWHILQSTYGGWQGPEDQNPKAAGNPAAKSLDLDAHLANPAPYAFASESERSSFAGELGRLASVAQEEAGYAHAYGLGDPITPETLVSEYNRKQNLVLEVKRKWAGLDESLQDRFGRDYAAFMAWNGALMGLFKQELQRRAR